MANKKQFKHSLVLALHFCIHTSRKTCIHNVLFFIVTVSCISSIHTNCITFSVTDGTHAIFTTMDNGVDVPIYALCLIIIAMVIMFVAIIILIILLKKSKSSGSQYKTFSRPNTAPLGLDKPDYQRQESNKDLGSLKSSPKVLSECDSVKVEDQFFKHSCSIRNMSNLETSLSSNEVNLSPRVRKPVPTSVILPEQMKAICRDVLNKRPADNNTSYKEIIDILHEFNKHEKPAASGDKSNNMREKSMSTPDLDIYDSTLARKSEDGNSTSDLEIYVSPPARKLEEANEIYNNIEDERKMEEDDNDIPVYDSLPSPYHLAPKQNVIVDQDTQYLLPLSGAAIEQEPSYVNANRNNYIL